MGVNESGRDFAKLAGRIIEFVKTELGIDDEEITVDTPLVTNGLVDSAGLMRLAAFVERETGTTIPDRDVNVGHFDTVRQIQAYLTRRSGGS